MRHFTLALLLLVAAGVHAQTNDLEVQITVSKPTILLGEPVWVLVTATNHSAQALAVDWGSPCFMFNETPITIEIPSATQGNGEPKFCGNMGGNCARGWDPPIDPGETQTRRYVLQGNFRITQPGHYDVIIHKPMPHTTAPLKPGIHFPPPNPNQTIEAKLTLDVLPANPVSLLTLEQQLAASALSIPPKVPWTYPHGLSQQATDEAFRIHDAQQRKQEIIDSHNRYAIFEGLAKYPAAGMEAIFVDWETPPHSVGYGMSALKHLNTPAAREALARWATGDPKAPLPPHTNTPQGEQAARSVQQNFRAFAAGALTEMGDTSYLPFLEALTSDPSQTVRQQVVLGLGHLGGEAEISFLVKFARQAITAEDRQDAVMSLGRTASAKAIPHLIDLFTLSDADQPSSSGYALMALTHHTLPQIQRLRTSEENQTEWRTWWQTHAATARIFSEYDCAEHYDQ